MLSTFDLRGRMKLCSHLLERGCVPGSLCGSRRGRAKQGGEERVGGGREREGERDRGRDTEALLFRYKWPSRQKAMGSVAPLCPSPWGSEHHKLPV